MSIQSEINRINNDVDTQTELITSIKSALESKAASGGSSDYSIVNPLNGANLLNCENQAHDYKFNNFTPVKASMSIMADFNNPFNSYFYSEVDMNFAYTTNSEVTIWLYDDGHLEASGDFSNYTTTRTFLVSFQDENNNILSDYFTCICE